ASTMTGHMLLKLMGYPGLVVQGPLLATWLSLFVASKSGRKLKIFRFRAKRPVFDLHNFNLIGDLTGKDTANIRVLDHQSQLAITAEAEFLPL
ncbi:MAG: acyl-CoA dehydrogenase, partial [Deltaproteobacteria bacterium]|nr:acyl-CoA dehydrogenase [Deltaproteobacteria bacterium]